VGVVLHDDPEVAAAQARERTLLERARRGDMEAFDALITPLLPRALALARRFMRQSQDADDVVQDACLRVLDRIHQHDGQHAFAPWFFKILVNLALNAQQVRKRRDHEPLSDVTVLPRDAPADVAVRAEIRDRFAAAVGTLPPRQRQIVMMHEVDGWAATEIAEVLSLSAATVRWHLHEARRTLRQALDGLQSSHEQVTTDGPGVGETR
jgi:RNA polymerase sigma-70 factor (ECF subfamily)